MSTTRAMTESEMAALPRDPVTGAFTCPGAMTVLARNVQPGDIVRQKYAGNPGDPMVGRVRWNHSARAAGYRLFEYESGHMVAGYRQREPVHIVRPQ